jgi:dolichyl-phosphate-mannose--protein O-mannosyl transferase
MLLAAARFADDNFADMLPRTETNYSYHDMQYVTMRTVPAFFATAIIPRSFFIVRTVGGTRLTDLCSGLFCLVDFLLIALAKHIMMDGIVQFFVAMTVFFTAISSHYREVSHDKGSQPLQKAQNSTPCRFSTTSTMAPSCIGRSS